MRSNDDGLPRLPRACNSVPQQPPCHGVHPSRRLIQEDDRRPTNQSHTCTQLPFVSTTACVEGYWAAQNTELVKLMPTAWQRRMRNGTDLCFYTVDSPVATDQFISMRFQQQRPQDILHTARHILLGYTSEPGIHAQSFFSRHVVQHSIKLRAVTNALLHLQSRDKCPLSNSELLNCNSPLEIQQSSIQKLNSCPHLLNVPQDAVPINESIPGGDTLITCQHLKGCGLPCSIEA